MTEPSNLRDAALEALCPFTDRPAWECAAACTCAHFKPTAIIGHAHPPAAPVEPVARPIQYDYRRGEQHVTTLQRCDDVFTAEEGWTETPLYAHPPAAPTKALVEKVARALAKSNGDDPDMRLAPGDEYERAWQLYADDARAALAAMQEAKP